MSSDAHALSASWQFIHWAREEAAFHRGEAEWMCNLSAEVYL